MSSRSTASDQPHDGGRARRPPSGARRRGAEAPAPTRRRWRWLWPERGYLEQSRSLFNSLVLVGPIFLLYQVGIIFQLSTREGGFALNGADYVTATALRLLGGSLPAYVCFVVVSAVTLGLVLYSQGKRDRLSPRIFLPVILESSIYALLFGATIHMFMGLPSFLASIGVLSAGGAPQGLGMKVFHALGAGFNEEIIFRLGLFGGILYGGRHARLPRWAVVIAALLISSAAFSAFHYIGPYADTLTMDSFAFRFLAGVLLALLFWGRGLAVAVYTHAVYDLYFFMMVSA